MLKALDEAVSLFRQGRFAEAIARLDRGPTAADERMRADVVRAELLERLGRTDESHRLVDQLRKGELSPSDESICEFVLGQIAWETIGAAERAIEHVQRAVTLARQADDLPRLCHAQLRLMVMLAESAGPLSVSTLVGELRWNAVRLADPHLSAALHVMLGETEAKRGLLDTAERHTALGQRLLEATIPNPWLEGLAVNTRVAIDIMRSDFPSALAHARRALALAERSGAAALRRAVLANLGNVLHLMGEFEQAVAHWARALEVLPTAGERSHATLESLASLYSAQGRLTEAEGILVTIDSAVRTEAAARLYGNRHARLALARVRARQGATAEAFSMTDSVVTIAERTGDRILEAHALIVRAEMLAAGGAVREALSNLSELAATLRDLPADVRPRYECALAACASAIGHETRTRIHIGRARRIWTGLHNVPALLEVNRAFALADDGHLSGPRALGDRAEGVRAAIQDVSILVQHTGHPALLATSVVDLLRAGDTVAEVTAIALAEDGSREVLDSHHVAEGDRRVMPARRYDLGTTAGRRIELSCRPWCDVDAVATVNAVTMLLHLVRHLESTEAEREERVTLWPSDELVGDFGDAVIGGRMKAIIASARRMATSAAGVLITGESGTGKEIVARDVHRSSGRAHRPFVTFNCSTVPRDLIESQLFGHRRGAFTGAERDHVGLIRAAHAGTLFLDEVGDLPLDVQPKLLRFLELGEITPLGESRTIRVDTRIVAATNADLPRMVEDGRFRGDLYYRLNILPLSIPPLRDRRDEIPGLVHHFVARAAVEFSRRSLRVSDELMEHLVLYRWPGNVRQLNNELRRIVALAESGQTLTPAALAPEIRRASAVRTADAEVTVALGTKLTSALAGVEREMIRAALKEHGGHIEQTAKALGISRKGLYLKRQRFGL